jgi:hypothetical protein
LETSYEVEKEAYTLNTTEALGIDLGTASNLLACVDTNGNSLLVDLRQAKAMNQLYNKRSLNAKKVNLKITGTEFVMPSLVSAITKCATW